MTSEKPLEARFEMSFTIHSSLTIWQSFMGALPIAVLLGVPGVELQLAVEDGLLADP